MTYNRDMQEDKEPLFEAFDQTSGSLAMAKTVAESVTLASGQTGSGGRRKLGRCDRSGRRARAQRNALFIARIRSSGSLCSKASRTAEKPSHWSGAELAAFAPEFKPEMARLAESHRGHEEPGARRRHRPAAVARALAEAAGR